MPSNKPRIGRCPQCEKSCRIDQENIFRPFCSERCKMVDLGDWLDERNVISEPTQPWDTSAELPED